MKKEEKRIKELAEFMHNEYENYAIKVGWKTQKKCQTLFDELPPANREVMLWVAKSVYDKLLQAQKEEIIKIIGKRADKLYCTAEHLGYHDKNCEGLSCEKAVLEDLKSKIKDL